MKKILYSASAIVAVAAMVLYSTGAFFSDTETSTGNVFTAGAIDLKVDSQQHYNHMVCTLGGPDGSDGIKPSTWQPEAGFSPEIGHYPRMGDPCGGTWGQQTPGVDITSEKFFNFTDVKPGDEGENTISLHVINNDAWICASVTDLTSNDVSQTEPETTAPLDTDDMTSGELDDAMLWTVWRDDGAGNGVKGDNIRNGTEQILASGHPVNGTLALYDATTNTGPLPGGTTGYLGVSWSLPSSVGNEAQTDSLTGTISFSVVQSRNNMDYRCGQSQEEPRRLVLENENMTTSPDWTPITGDGIGGVLTWAGDGTTFNYSVTASGLPANTNYSLIYYADPYPGNNPGALIGTGTTNGSGNLSFAGNPNLGIDLPMPADTNSGSPHFGAKIWLIPSANYNAGTKSVTPWTPDNTWLFEGNVYINYNDTNN